MEARPDQALPVPSRHTAGEVLANKYRLERPLGEGGQASVWLATNLVLEAPVAVKLVNGEGTEDQMMRLWHEARIIARLNHPAIVRVFDVDRTSDGEPFVVMELLEGETLRDLLDRKRRLGAREAVQLLLPIADALASAHAQDVVHRDVKPENIFLCRSDDGLRSKLLDFGTVKFPTREGWRRTTADGYVVGTPGYLAPEQVLGHDDLDRRADVWGLCVTLYEMLAGRTPFDGATVEQVLRAAVVDEVTPVGKFVACDPRLWKIIARGLAKHPCDRWSSVGELGSALAQWLSDEGVLDDISGVLLQRRWLGGSSDGAAAFSEDSVSGHAVALPSAQRTHRRLPKRLAIGGAALLLASAAAWTLIGRSVSGGATSHASSVVARAERPIVQPLAAAVTLSPSLEPTPSPSEPPAEHHGALPAETPERAPQTPAPAHPAPTSRRALATPRATLAAAPSSATKPSAPPARNARASDLINPY